MEKQMVHMILIGIGVLGVMGCTETSHRMSQGGANIPMQSTMPRHIHDLAGAWDYEDKSGSYVIRLNEEGHGTYDWEDGQFTTRDLQEGVWKGSWFQAGNDREGGFELEWAEDSSMARGRWWYTRIGQDTNPLKPGGTFTMKRTPSLFSSK
jgi:hypothetical protein